MLTKKIIRKILRYRHLSLNVGKDKMYSTLWGIRLPGFVTELHRKLLRY